LHLEITTRALITLFPEDHLELNLLQSLTEEITPILDNQNASFFNTDRLHQCVDEPCSNPGPIYPASAEESGPAYGYPIADESTATGGSSTSSTTAPAPAPLTTHAAAPLPLTTHAAASPLTTHAAVAVPLTTHAVATPLTTHAVATPLTTHTVVATPLTTHAVAPMTTNAVVPVTSTSTTGEMSTGQNCANAVTLSSSTVSISGIDQWSNVFQMTINLNVAEQVLTNWLVEIIWPANAVSTSVITTYNGGVVVCQSTTPNRHVMIAPVGAWANNLQKGTSLTIIVQAENTNMNNQFIEANTQFKVYKQ